MLLSWAAGRPELGSFGKSYVPTAPSTAVMLIGLAAASWLAQTRSPLRPVPWLIGLGVLGATAVVVLQYLFAIELPFLPHTSIIDAAGTPVVGRMSPLAALAAMLVTAALLLQLGREPRSRARRQAAAIVAVIVIAVSSSVTLSYLLQVPLFYRSGVIPMAVPTAIAFTFLGFGLLGGTGRDTWPMALASRGRLTDAAASRLTTGYLALGLLLLAGIAVSGYEYLRYEHADVRRMAAENVSAVADLKVRQVSAWYRERTADAAAIFAAPLQIDVSRIDTDAAMRGRVAEWLESLHREYGYAVAALVDPDGAVRLAVPAGAPVDPTILDAARVAGRQKSVVVRDLHRQSSNPTVALSLLVPVRSSTGPGAVLVLQADAERSLLRLLEGWPTRSPTAEVLLIRREGQTVVFLSALRHQDDPALTLRVPLEHPSALIAGRLLDGNENVSEGTDYRGVRVLAAVRRVPRTPWYVVSKIDTEEIDAAYRQQVSRTALFLSILLLAVAAGVSLLWYRRSLASAEREIVLTGRLRRMIESNVIGIVIAGPDGEIFDANDYYLKMIGLTREDLALGRVDWRNLTPPEWRAADDRAIEELRTRGICTPYEKEYFRVDGTRVPVLLADAMLPGPDAQIAAFVLDLTDRKRDAIELGALARERQLALNAARMGWWSYDPVARTASLDDRACEIFGVAPGECDVDAFFALMHPDDLPRVKASIAAALDPAAPQTHSIEYRLNLPDGSVRWVEASFIATFEGGASRHATRIVGTLENITERKLAEASLSERMEELRRWHVATLGRENRILELKLEVNELLKRSGDQPRYQSVSGLAGSSHAKNDDPEADSA